MKRSEVISTVVLVPLDFVLLLTAALSAYTLRFGGTHFVFLQPAVSLIPFDEYWSTSMLVSLLYLLIFAAIGLYTMGARRSFGDELFRILAGCSTGIMVVIFIIFFSRELFASRFIVLAAWALSIIYLTAGHTIIHLVKQMLFRAGFASTKVALVGNDKSLKDLKETLETKGSGYTVVGIFKTLDEKEQRTILDAGVEEIITDLESRDDQVAALDFAESHQIAFSYLADLFATHTSRKVPGTFFGYPLVHVKPTPLDGWGRVYKRLFDFFASLLLLIITSPLFFVISLAIITTSGFPIFFRQTRTGAGARTFKLLKFRSMKNGAEEIWKQRLKKNHHGPPVTKWLDPEWQKLVTPIGRLLRRTSLDELPQLWNVLMGDMSLVGPRPHVPEEVARYERRHRRLLSVKPGVTGMAQVSGRSDLDFEDEVRLDTHYIENWKPSLDLVILLKTPAVVLTNKGAY